MKKYYSYILCCFFVSLMLFTGCDSAANFNLNDTDSSKESDADALDVSVSDMQAKNVLKADDIDSKDSKDSVKLSLDNLSSNEAADEYMVFSGDVPTEYIEEYSETYNVKLTAYNSGRAILDVTNDYDKGSYSVSHYEGTYTLQNNEYVVDYSMMADNYRAYIKVEDDKVVAFESSYVDNTDFSGITGTYTCHSDEYGDLILDVFSDGNANLKVKGETMTGYIYMYNNTDWDLDVHNEDYSEYLDWFVYFGGHTFTYVPYLETVYSQYEGVYGMDGQLGHIDLTVGKDGKAYAYVKIDGKNTYMSGSIGADENAGLQSVYLTDESENYSMYLDLVYVGENAGFDGEWGYSGTLTYTEVTVLNAG